MSKMLYHETQFGAAFCMSWQGNGQTRSNSATKRN